MTDPKEIVYMPIDQQISGHLASIKFYNELRDRNGVLVHVLWLKEKFEKFKKTEK